MYIQLCTNMVQPSELITVLTHLFRTEFQLVSRQVVGKSQAPRTKVLCAQPRYKLTKLIYEPSHQLHHITIVNAANFLQKHIKPVSGTGNSTGTAQLRNLTDQLLFYSISKFRISNSYFTVAMLWQCFSSTTYNKVILCELH